jgi:hypothetical protein
MPLPETGNLPLGDSMDVHELEQDEFLNLAVGERPAQRRTENVDDGRIRLRGPAGCLRIL